MRHYIKQNFFNKKYKYKPIVFLDRDGVILKNRDFILNKKDISFYKSAVDAIKLLNSYNLPVVIITNQPGVARGWITIRDLKEINQEIVKQLSQQNAFIDAIYSCPHHPQANLIEFRTVCSCRKPATLLLKDAFRDFNAETKRSYFIGDKTTDIQAGKDIGSVTFLVKTGYGGKDKKCEVVPDYTCQNALQAVKKILKDFNL